MLSTFAIDPGILSWAIQVKACIIQLCVENTLYVAIRSVLCLSIVCKNSDYLRFISWQVAKYVLAWERGWRVKTVYTWRVSVYKCLIKKKRVMNTFDRFLKQLIHTSFNDSDIMIRPEGWSELLTVKGKKRMNKVTQRKISNKS